MKMKIRICSVAALILFAFAAITGCKEDETVINTNFTLSVEEASFDGNTLSLSCENQTVSINMNMEVIGKWVAFCPIDDMWCIIQRSGNRLLLTVKPNATGIRRSTWVEFSLGDNIRRINVSQDYLRVLSFPSESVTVGAARHDEYIPLTTNISLEQLSARVTYPANCDWITNLAVNTVALTFNIQRNPSMEGTRTATITVTGDGESVLLNVVQSPLSGYPYEIDISNAKFDDCYIYEIWDEDHNIKIGELCKEYLHKNDGSEVVRRQTVVAYPIANGKVDLSRGLVVDNGYFVGWNPSVTSSTPHYEVLASYSEGESVGFMPTKLYLDEGATRFSTINIGAAAEDRVYAKLRPLLLRDQRSGPTNNQGESSESFSYKIVKIGTQYWMAENLRTSRYNDGENIPTNIANATWALLPGTPGCVISTEAGTRYLDVNAPAAQADRLLVGVLYNFNAIVRQNTAVGVPLPTADLKDMLSPAGWSVPTRAQIDILRNYTSQSTVITNLTAHELNYAGTGAFANATGFGIRGNGQRGASGGWNSNITLLGSITYSYYATNADHLQHGFYSLRMDPVTSIITVAGSGTSGQGSGFYVAIAGHSVRCLRND